MGGGGLEASRAGRRRFLVPALLAACAAACALAGCPGKAPISVGFVAQLTGVQSELGVQERDGALLAMDEINAAGGVAGRRIKLIVRDDLGTPDGARAADRELVAAGVAAIIGHATSGMAMAGLEVTDPARVVMLSPTVSSPVFSGKKDYFFRIVQTAERQAERFAQRVFDGRGIRRVGIVYDTDNAAYTTAYMKAFSEKYRALGGAIAAEADFSSKAQPNFSPLVARLRAGKPDGILMITGDIDAALIAQRTRMMGWPVPLFTTAWAQTETLINSGGKAVEGLEIELIRAVNEQTPEYLDYVERFRTRFGTVPSFGAVMGYEAAKVLAIALEKTGGRALGLPQALSGIRDFKGLSDTYSFDEYGDASRPIHLGVIRQGKYASTEAAAPASSQR
jgi:branched-chain amino acid transport system substrate-binding protein